MYKDKIIYERTRQVSVPAQRKGPEKEFNWRDYIGPDNRPWYKKQNWGRRFKNAGIGALVGMGVGIAGTGACFLIYGPPADGFTGRWVVVFLAIMCSVFGFFDKEAK